MLKQAAGLIGYAVLFACFLFVPAGTLAWPAAWVLLATMLVVRGVSVALLWRSQRALLEARTSVPIPQGGQPLADRILLPLWMASFAGLVAFTSADVWHLHLLPIPADWLRGIGLAVFAAGWWVVYLALRTNAFALTVVRHQSEREQKVIDAGPYALVRHPMYAGIVVVMVGQALWLGSFAGLVAALLPTLVLALRIIGEERLLVNSLPGYTAYASRVRSRLIPGVW